MKAISEITQQSPLVGTGNAEATFVVSVTSNPHGCTYPTNFYFVVSDARRERMFSMLLAAQAAGRAVKLYVSGTCHAWGSSLVDGINVIS